MKYERFTERVGKGIAIKETSTNDNRSIWNAIEHLAELEDKIEQETMIELPCKVGDTVYVIYQYADFLGNTDNPFIEKETAQFFIYDDNKMKIVPSNYAERDDYWYKVLDILLTREEAEKRLKELQNG